MPGQDLGVTAYAFSLSAARCSAACLEKASVTLCDGCVWMLAAAVHTTVGAMQEHHSGTSMRALPRSSMRPARTW